MEAVNSSSGVTGIIITTTTSTMDDNRGRDCISKLPNDLLHRILSLLDMKQVVQTSILSSRWRYLWVSMPSFNFDQKVFKSCKTVNSNSYRFVKFVDMVLQTKSSIKTLVLYCVSDYFVGSEQVYKWIVDAVRLNVSVLELKIIYDCDDVIKPSPLTLPLCLFTCKTLTSLKIDLGFLTRNTLVLSLPADSSVCLTALKTLHLSSLCLIGDESTDSFFSRCPVLETLSISHCRFEKAYKSNYLPSSIFTCGTLVSLKLKSFFRDTPIFNSIPDSVVILPSLKCLHLQSLLLFSGESTANLFFSNCPSLESLILNVCKLHVDADVLPRYACTCKTLVKLKVVGCSTSKIFRIPDLCSLPCLKALSLNSLRFPGGEITEKFFLGCPVLETLIISNCSFIITENFFLGCPVLGTLPVLETLSLGCPVLETLIISNCSFTITENFFFGCPVLKTLIISDCSFTISSFFCRSLTKLVLKTHGSTFYRISLPADSMSLPALKTLHLESLLLSGKDSITNLSTSCPVMESLTIMKCVFHGVHLNIYSHNLRHLTIVNDKRWCSYVYVYASKGNVVRYFFDRYYEVKLKAPNLTSFICDDYMSKVYTIENLSFIVQVYINLDMEIEELQEARPTSHLLKQLPEDTKQTYATEKEQKKQLYAQQMMKNLGGLCNVKNLILSAWFLEVVSGALDLPDSPTIQFCNLKILKLRTWRTLDCAHAVMYLLERSPNIESLSVKFAEIPLSSPFFEKNPAGKDYWEERLALNCMLHHLTSVKLKDFSGCYPELKFVEFLLKNAMNLQKLMICFFTIENPMNNAESSVVKVSEEEILSFPRASASVEILFMPS